APCGVEIVRQTREARRRDAGVRPLHGVQPGLTGLYSTKRHLPALLKLRGDQAIVGIPGTVAPSPERRFVASLLQPGLHEALLFPLRFDVTPLGLHRRFDRYWLNGAEKLPGDRGVDPYAAECEAPGQSERLVRTLTPIDGLSRRTARVTHHQVPPTATTGQQP